MPVIESAQKKRRTVAGCWTCRARKVKCDGTKPACQRCLKAKLGCKGYDVQLRWSTPWSVQPDGKLKRHETQDIDNRAQRSFIEFVQFDRPVSFDQVDYIMDALAEESLSDLREKRVGPFGVYKLQLPIQAQNQVSEILTDGKIWIDSGLISLASISYMAVCGEILKAPSLNMSELKVKLFPNFFGLKPPNSIEQNVRLQQSETDNSKRVSFAHLFSDLQMGPPSSNLMNSLLLSPHVQGLISSFMSNLYRLSFVCLKTGVLESVFKPILLRVVGEGLIGLYNNQHELTLKKCLILQMISIASIQRSRSQASEKFLSVSIHSRLASLTILSKFFTARNDDGDIQVTQSALGSFQEVTMVKEFIIALLLQLILDDYFDIVSEHRVLFTILEHITSFINENPSNSEYKSDNELQQILKWATIMWEFHRSTSTIDLQKYSVDGDDYADILDHDYNLVDFLEDSGTTGSSSKISIKPIDVLENDKEPDCSSKDSSDDSGDSDSETERDQPKRFAIQFNFDPTCDGEESEDHDSESDEETATSDSEVKRDIQPSGLQGKQIAFVVELEFGIPDSLFVLLNKCSTLANHRNFFMGKQLHPRNFPKIICDVEEELKSWQLDWQVMTENGAYISQFHEVMFHSSMCFHDSLIVYFYRLLKDVSPLALQRQVTSCVQHLEAITKLKAKNADYSVEACRHFWPFFICGCDAVDVSLQQRYLRLFEEWKCTKWLGKQIMLEVWRCRSEGDEETSWIDVIKDWKFTGYH